MDNLRMTANCSNCGGFGKIIVYDEKGAQHNVNCPACNGSGRNFDNRLFECPERAIPRTVGTLTTRRGTRCSKSGTTLNKRTRSSTTPKLFVRRRDVVA